MNLLPPPGPERKRMTALLVLLVIALGLYFGPQYWPSTTAATAATSNTQRAGTSADKKIPMPEPVKLASLDAAPESSDSSRNPFKFGQKPLPPAPPAPPPTPYVPPPPPSPPQPQGPPLINLKCLGIEQVKETKQWVGAMQDPDSGATFWVIDGKVIDGKYKVLKVTADSVTVSYLDGSGQRTIRSGGQE
jgi:hypothetical protein